MQKFQTYGDLLLLEFLVQEPREAEEHFNGSMKMDADLRYFYEPPVDQGHPPLPTFRNVAERKLKNCIDSLRENHIALEA